MKIELKQCLLFFVLLWVSGTSVCLAQRGVPASRVTGFTLFGDVEVSGETVSDSRALTFDLLLYSRSGVLIDRQKVASKGRYRFLNVPTGDYDLVIEFENSEVARTQIHLIGTLTDLRQDITLEWRATSGKSAKTEVVSADEFYQRIPLNQ